MNSKAITVLTAVGWPGGEATGPVQSLIGLANALSGEFCFKALVRERPFGRGEGETKPENWVRHGSLDILWCRMTPFGPSGFASILRSTPHDVLMLNGFFDPEFTIPALMLRWRGRIPRQPTVLAPRGEFSAGALGLKSSRKWAYLWLARRLGLLDDVCLHATGIREAEDIARGFPYARRILVAPNVRELGSPPAVREIAARKGPLRLAFLGRIARVKNLDYALRVLCKVTTPTTLDIFGPVQDPDYWGECLALIADLPSHVSVTLQGEIPNDQVPDKLADFDLLFLPTRGENFGHAILDALLVGTPVLISDQTPFVSLENEGAGWSLPLDAPDRFVLGIETCARMSPSAVMSMRTAARRLAERTIIESDSVAANRRMLAATLAACSSKARP